MTDFKRWVDSARKWEALALAFGIGEQCQLELTLHCANGEQTVSYKVVDVLRETTFAKLYEQLGKSLLPDVDSIDGAAQKYKSWYTDEEVAEHGVVAFQIVRYDV